MPMESLMRLMWVGGGSLRVKHEPRSEKEGILTCANCILVGVSRYDMIQGSDMHVAYLVSKTS